MAKINTGLALLMLSALFLCPHKMHEAQCEEVEVVETVCSHEHHEHEHREHEHHNETKPAHEHQSCDQDAGHDHLFVLSKSLFVPTAQFALLEIKTASDLILLDLAKIEWRSAEILHLKHRTSFHELQGVCLLV